MVVAVGAARTCANRLAVFAELPAPPIQTHCPIWKIVESGTVTVALPAVILPVVKPRLRARTLTAALFPNGTNGTMASDDTPAANPPGATVTSVIGTPLATLASAAIAAVPRVEITPSTITENGEFKNAGTRPGPMPSF